MSQRLSVQYIDLRLRADFPFVKTEIHELVQSHHIIYVPAEQLDEAEFGAEFESRFRTIGVRVTFSNRRPELSTVIPPISDREIGEYIAALSLTRGELETVLAGKFPQLPKIVEMRDGPGYEMTFAFGGAIPENIKEKVEAFLRECLNGRRFSMVVAAETRASERPSRIPGDLPAIDITSFKPIAQRPKLPTFVEAEEQWWFENLSGLFEGSISPRSFDFREDAGAACYINAAMPVSLDIRHALLTYDTIYIEPPFSEELRMRFWENQTITQSDLLSLVEQDRVRILHSQPEERSDLGFLREAHEANPKGVIGRRRSAAMMAADVVETADEYLLSKPEIFRLLPELVSRIAEATKSPTNEIARAMLYPIKARREAFRPLLCNGLLGYSAIGQGALFAETYERITGKEVALEGGMFGREVHVAHMLDSTLVPAAPSADLARSWLPVMEIMGDRLNFYRNYNSRVSAKWAENERRKETRQIVLPPIPLFEFHRNASLDDILSLTSSPVGRRKGRALLSRLAALNPEDQIVEIAKLEEALAKQKKVSTVVDAILTLDSALGVATYFTNTNLFPFVASFAMLQLALRCAKKAPVLDVIVDEIETSLREVVGLNEDLTFLSKLSRVGFLTPPPAK